MAYPLPDGTGTEEREPELERERTSQREPECTGANNSLASHMHALRITSRKAKRNESKLITITAAFRAVIVLPVTLHSLLVPCRVRIADFNRNRTKKPTTSRGQFAHFARIRMRSLGEQFWVEMIIDPDDHDNHSGLPRSPIERERRQKGHHEKGVS